MKNNRRAAQMLANELIERGAEVYFNVLPSVSNDGKTGVDDFVIAKGIEAYRTLREAATRMEVVEFLDGLTIDQVIERMNAKYMVVNENGKAFIYEPGFDQTLGRRRITRIKFNDFRELYLNATVVTGANSNGNPVIKTWANAWLEHRDRGQYLGGVVFDPSGKSPKDVYNLWQGFHIEPVKGDWSLLRDLIEDVICGGNKAHFEYLMNWMALVVQKPAQQGEVAVVMRGLKGTGKGTLAKALHHIIGQHALTVSNSKHLTGSFNAHLRDCIFLFADEAFFAGDKAHIGILKSLITDPHLAIEGKGRDVVQAPNYLHIMMASNEDWVVPASPDERRYFVRDVSEKRRGDHAYFTRLYRQLDTGGYEAMLYDLLNRDLTGFDVRAVPTTTGLQEQQKLSLPTADAWWMECLMRGHVYLSPHGTDGFLGDWAEQVSTDILYASYTAFAKGAMDRHPLLRETFESFMAKMGAEKRRLNKALIADGFNSPVFGNRPHGYHLGTLESAQAAFCRVTRLAIDWPSAGVEDAAPAAPTPCKKAKY